MENRTLQLHRILLAEIYSKEKLLMPTIIALFAVFNLCLTAFELGYLIKRSNKTQNSRPTW